MGRETTGLIGEVPHTGDAVGSRWSGRRKGWLVPGARQQGDGCSDLVLSRSFGDSYQQGPASKGRLRRC